MSCNFFGVTVQRLRLQLTSSVAGIILLGLVSSIAAAAPYSLSYGGRITDGTGKPVDGSVTLRVEFYRADTGGSPLAVALGDFNVTLVNGVFQLPISLQDDDFHFVFNGTDAVWIQVTDLTHNKVYPRQSFSAVPYALKVPVDPAVLTYDADGKLTLSAPPENGKYLSSSGGVLTWASPAGSGDMNRAVYDTNGSDTVDDAERLGGQLPSFYTNATNITAGTLPAAQVPNLDASKITTGNFGAARVTTDASNRFVTDAEKTSWNNAVSWGNHATAGYANRASFSVSGGGPLTYNNTNGQFSLGAASLFTDGYLSSANFSVFNSKQDAIGAATNLGLGELTANGHVRVMNDAATQGVTIKARDNLAASWTMTLPANPGSNLEVLQTDGNGNLSWAPMGSAPVQTVNGQTGTVTLDAGDIAPTATRLWLSDTDKTKIDNLPATADVMVKSVYDSNDDGKVNAAVTSDSATSATTAATATNATQLGGQAPSYYLDAANLTGTIADARIPGTIARNADLPASTDDVPEGASNKYFSNTAARAAVSASAPLNYVTATGVLSLPEATGSVDGYLSSTNFAIFSNKQNAITATTDLTLDDLQANGSVRFMNDTAAEGVTIKAPDALGSSWTLTLPTTDGGSGEVLATDGNGVLSWVSAGGTGDMQKSVYDGNNDGKVDTAAAADTAATAADASQLGGEDPSFYLDAANLTGTIDDARIPAAITRDSEVTTAARAAVSSGGAPLSYSSATGVFSLGQASVITDGYLSATDWSTFNNKQNALGFTPLNKGGDTMGGDLAMGAHKITGLAEPDDGQDGATKNYVDSAVSVKQNELGFTPLNAAGGTVSGNLTVGGQLTISGGAPAAGKVLTSNAAGLATWEVPASGGDPSYSSSAASPNDAVYVDDAGRVGIGTQSPESALHVGGPVSTGAGGIKWKTFSGTTTSGDVTTFAHGLAAANVVSFNCMLKSANGYYYNMGYLEGASSLNRLVRISGANAELNHQSDANFHSQQYRCIAQYVEAVSGADGFSAVTGTGLSGSITVTIDFPGDTSNYDHVEVRRIAGAVAPSAACNGGGDNVTNFVTFTDTSYTDSFADDGIVGGTYHSYRLCIYGTDGSLTSFSIAQNVMAKLPANVTSFTAVQGTANAGDINASISFPGAGETASYNRVEVRRVSGATPPAASCTDGGDNVRTYNTYTGGAYVDSGLTPNAYYSYRVCVFGHDGSLVSSTTVANVRAKPAEHIAFVTSNTYQANLGGVAGADSICTSLANAAGLAGSYKALLSTLTEDVRDRVPISAVVYNVSGQVIANDYTDMWDGSLQRAINLDQNGVTRTGNVWSGSNSDGTRHTDTVWDTMCSNWTTNVSNQDALFGLGGTSNTWLGFSNEDLECNQSMRFYCISQ